MGSLPLDYSVLDDIVFLKDIITRMSSIAKEYYPSELYSSLGAGLKKIRDNHQLKIQ